MRSLTARLVLTSVALVAVVLLLIGAATALAMRSYLTHQLDQKVESSVRRASDGPPTLPPGDQLPPSSDGSLDDDPDARRAFGNQEPGTLISRPAQDGFVVGDRSGTDTELSNAALATLEDVPSDGEVHAVKVDGVGSYRVIARDTDAGLIVTGLPTADLDASTVSLVRLEILLALLGIAAASGVGLFVVRHQLRPLVEVADTAHLVADLPLDRGRVRLTERVPEHLTDERTEVGQVGSALNTLLEHVESSLAARESSEQRVRQFVADASHELRTPLTTIAGYTELARKRPDDASATHLALEKVSEESARMTALVEDLLTLARLDAGRPLDRERVDLTRMALDALGDARVVSPAHNWQLVLPDHSVEVTGDALRLHQVLTNLLTNARKYTPADTTVTLRVVDDPASGTGFDVHDDGPGFAPELVSHAFERFARGDVARHREGGVGLGLSLVQAIAVAHGGTVSLTSTPGDTRISVRLPRGRQR